MSEQSDLDKKVHEWFGLPPDFTIKAQASRSHFERLDRKHKELKRWSNKRDGKSLSQRAAIDLKVKGLSKEYWELFHKGPTFPKS